jgi:RNA recognition motif-containing protein
LLIAIQLKELFAVYNPTSAYIVPRQIPRFVIRKLAERGEPRKGRGFGFVTFEDEAAQKKAVEEMDGHEVESRAISVKVAIDKPKEEKENGDHHASAAANGSSS